MYSRCRQRAGSGFKLYVENLQTLSLNLGPHTTDPSVSIGVSLDYQPFFQVNVSAGANTIPLGVAKSIDNSRVFRTVVRINSEGWQNNRMNLESIELNPVSCLFHISHRSVVNEHHRPKGARLLPFKPSKLAFQFVGDSLSAVRINGIKGGSN